MVLVPAKYDFGDSDPMPQGRGYFQYSKCLICGGAQLHYLFSVSGNRVVQCEDCELLLVNPQPPDADIGSLPELESLGSFRDKECATEIYLQILKRYRGNDTGALLQLGCSQLQFLSQAAASGFQVTATDRSDKAREIAREGLRDNTSIEVATGYIGDLAGQSLYDTCIIFNELERARDPRLLLKHVHRLLRPDGVIFVITPSIQPPRRSFEAARFRADQLFYFRNSALQSLLVDCGFGKIIAAPNGSVPLGNVGHLARKEIIRNRKILSVVVPVFNEGQTFSAAFDKLLAKQIEHFDIEIVVVESNSTDGTREQVLKYRDHPRVKVVLEDTPQGKGHAVRTGFQHITGDLVMIQDADLEYDLEDYEALLEPLRRNRAAFVLGARHGGSAWKMRQFNDQPVVATILNFAHWFFTALINVGFGARLKDPFTMYKVFRRDCLYGIRFECNRFDFDWEIVINFLRKGYQPLEIPVNYRSRSFAEGKKVSFFRDPLTWFRIFLKLRLSDFDPLNEIERQRREKMEQELAVATQRR